MAFGALNTGYELIIIEGQEKGMHFPLVQQELHIGRRPHPGASDPTWIYVGEPSVSRHHATLRWDEEKGKYQLQHVSRTNPTLVNGRPVQNCDMNPNDTLRMGLLVFKVVRQMGNRTLRRMAKVGGGQDKDERIKAAATFRLLVLEGPDRGRVWSLDKKMVTIGRRGGRKDAGDEGIFLNDETIPFQQCILVWDEKNKYYTAMQIENSPLPTVVYRPSGKPTSQLPLDPKKPTELRTEDIIIMGLTSLVFRVAAPSGEQLSGPWQ